MRESEPWNEYLSRNWWVLVVIMYLTGVWSLLAIG